MKVWLRLLQRNVFYYLLPIVLSEKSKTQSFSIYIDTEQRKTAHFKKLEPANVWLKELKRPISYQNSYLIFCLSSNHFSFIVTCVFGGCCVPEKRLACAVLFSFFLSLFFLSILFLNSGSLDLVWWLLCNMHILVCLTSSSDIALMKNLLLSLHFRGLLVLWLTPQRRNQTHTLCSTRYLQLSHWSSSHAVHENIQC